ncbi:SCO family protein [Leptospira wolffii]|uniref:SCO family protein n=1 Tax=Leptospira wolffii TaxID=409998 RepID=UPI001083102A|nr:SCO family protein [Leptospira wolffii]TGK59939.1 SCO family protein [Leptospira wolffii]TGK67605.1 SCO family protein [Leptospira wolffii]TGK75947.1 SCO family protein [Leptospira wolffii]TGL30198.1 SCO family protein [Leptospira wolffii]
MKFGNFRNILGVFLAVLPLTFFLPLEKSPVIFIDDKDILDRLEIIRRKEDIKNLQTILLGKESAVYFGYLNCKTVCNGSIAGLKKVMLSQPEEKRIQLIFITLDPERDKSENFSRIIGDNGVHAILFRSKDSQSALALAKEFGTPANRIGSTNAEFNHRDSVFLINSNAKIVGVIPEFKNSWDKNSKLVSQSITEIFDQSKSKKTKIL